MKVIPNIKGRTKNCNLISEYLDIQNNINQQNNLSFCAVA